MYVHMEQDCKIKCYQCTMQNTILYNIEDNSVILLIHLISSNFDIFYFLYHFS